MIKTSRDPADLKESTSLNDVDSQGGLLVVIESHQPVV